MYMYTSILFIYIHMIYIKSVCINLNINTHTRIYTFPIQCLKFWWCTWQNSYHCMKFSMKLFAFHFMQMPRGKTWIHLFPTSHRSIVGQSVIFYLGKTTSLGEGKHWIQTRVLHLKLDLVSYHSFLTSWIHISRWISITYVNIHTQNLGSEVKWKHYLNVLTETGFDIIKIVTCSFRRNSKSYCLLWEL